MSKHKHYTGLAKPAVSHVLPADPPGDVLPAAAPVVATPPAPESVVEVPLAVEIAAETPSFPSGHPPSALGPRRFSVHLAARIPIGENPIVVEAENEDAAWREFCRVKHISGSDGQVTVKRLD